KDKKIEMKTEDRGNETSADRFLEKLRNFESTFKDNSGEISSSDDFNEDSENDEMKTAREDSDSSNEEWSDANNVTTMNMSLDHENGISHITLEEQCISTEDKDSFPSFSKFPKQREESEQNNFFCDKGNDNFFNDFSITPRLKQDKIKGLKRRLITEFTADIKKRKIVFDEEKTESHIEHENESKIQEKERNFSQNGPIKYKPHPSRTLNKKLKWKNIKYKKITQTDSYLSTDDDVEIFPIRAKRSKRAINFTICQFQDQNVDEELNYMADNEDSIDGFLQITHERISVIKTSFSSINSGFEKRASETSNMNIIAEQWSMNLPDRISSSRSRCSRAPPGFPELPQNPPLMSYIFDPQFILSSSNDNNDPNSFHPKSMAIVPPAPPPMRHLYYEYPEFMDLPSIC
ncbi:unnamed protein product, partial [Heterotrigona itama]